MPRIVPSFLAAVVFAVLSYFTQEARSAAENHVDFRYALPWWQSAICLPDDTDKALVGKEGQVLLDFGSGGFRNFGICLQPEIVGGAKWVRQQSLSPRVPVMQTWKDTAGVEVLEETFLVPPKSGKLRAQADAARRIVVLVTLKNTTGIEAVRQPALHIQGVARVQFSAKDGVVSLGPQTRITASDAIVTCENTSNTDCTIRLTPVTLASGASRQVAFVVDRHCGEPVAALTAIAAGALRDTAQLWWETSGLPFETIQIPDADIQAMLESCVRNIWQAREIIDGKPAFRVGPTVYRNLFVVDGAFILETVSMLGRDADARNGIEYLLSHQKPDGSFQVIDGNSGHRSGFTKENGIVLWAAFRHAQLSQDKKWLQAKWPALKRVVEVIRRLRTETLRHPESLDYDLMPGGAVDGGIDNALPGSKPEYSNVLWNLIGLKAAIDASRWLADEQSEVAWQKEYDAFYGAFRKAVARDTLQDKFGNAYVPTMMGNVGGFTPQKGQWTFCHAIYPGRLFVSGDSLVEGQMAMLRATKVEGLVFDTGWMKDGIWTYFASFYAHAALWMGHGTEASQVLYDFANHAVPTRVWREEQKPLGKGVEEVGDMPHNWASAEFIRLTTHLLEMDRGNELHLLEGMPAQWLKAGMSTKLNGVRTPFGPLHATVQVNKRKRTATLEVKPLAANCKSIVVHLPGGTVRRLPPERGGAIEFDVP